MKHVTALFAALLLCSASLLAQAPKKIWSYGIGNWRNGPVVIISPLFETTEQFTTPQLIARIRHDYAEFKDTTDIDVQRFATREEGDLSRTTVKGKYERRKEIKQVVMVEEPKKPAVPTPSGGGRTAPVQRK